MANLSGIVKQLKKERDRVQHQLSGLNAALAAFARVYRSGSKTKPRRKMSAKGRARIAAAQRARWAKVNGQQKVVPIAKPGKRTMSASARRKIAAAQRKRWANLCDKRRTLGMIALPGCKHQLVAQRAGWAKVRQQKKTAQTCSAPERPRDRF